MDAKTRKSELTRAAIIDAALELARSRGIAAISMRSIADSLQISKSGVFSRVGSIEALQQAVIEEYGRRFFAEVFLPSMKQSRGLPRLNAIMERWLHWFVSSDHTAGALHEAAAFSTDPMDAVIVAAIRDSLQSWVSTTRRTVVQAMQEGHLRADMDPDDLLYEMHSLLLGVLFGHAFLHDRKVVARCQRSYQRLISNYLP